MRLIIAFGAAVLAPTLALGAWYLYGQFATFESNDPYIWVRTRSFLSICLAISAAHVVVLGIPAYFLMRWRGLLRWWSALLAGFVLGALPAAVITWPLRYASPGSYASSNGVETMVNGVPTVAGWLQYMGGAASFGVCGLVAAAAFCAVRGMSPNSSSKPTPLRGAA
ncbi:hypothetical protein [Chiayiivirga flava]|uniref:ABC-type phosphate transport system auxiliary subunit n=1 Tax=Chiayiivirga flava TaxID=659595 RepID=A0A7W8D5N2_9GAMM|nr:hypothetical protein [Chiayiivirga flava]MBB5208002.1 ABC-type phosphate transport system auxiliary subunit [Chiayiivirga flava]